MLDATLKTQLKSYLEKVVYPLELVASLDDSAKAREMKELLQEIVLLSDKITLVEAFSGEAPYNHFFGEGLIAITPDGAPATPVTVTIPLTSEPPSGKNSF